MTVEHFALMYWLLAPAVPLMFQYGLDLVLDDVVPMSKKQIQRRLTYGR